MVLDGLTHEEADSHVIQVDATHQGFVLDETAIKLIGCHGLPLFPSQVLEGLFGIDDLSDRIGVQPVEMDQALSSTTGTFVSARPLLDVTIGADGDEVITRRDIGSVARCDQVREGQLTGIGMILDLPHTHGESADRGGPEDM